MRRDLGAPVAVAPLPAGIVLVPYDKAIANESRELMKRVYPDGLNDGGISFEGFWHWLTTDPEYDPDLMFVATAGGAVVGFCHCWTGSFVKDLVVAPEFRRRGLGGALLTLALEEFRRRGASAVDLKTDIDNVTAQSLYRRLGFEVIERVDV
jgi:ribosomal protein S18 acetylase RimI-like enzyme